MLGWHFVKNDRRLGYDDNRIVKAGRTYKVSRDKPLSLCKYGLHASKRCIDALKYSPGSVVCRVELLGEIRHDTDKSVAYERSVLWTLDAEMILHEFACRCAEGALKQVDNPDPRSIAAIKAKRDWMAGKITDSELAAAEAAVKAAAWKTAWITARNAAVSAYAAWGAACWTAWGAAWRAAEAAVKAEAWMAAEAAGEAEVWGAAWNSTQAAASSAAWRAAEATAKATQNRRLVSMIMAARRLA